VPSCALAFAYYAWRSAFGPGPTVEWVELKIKDAAKKNLPKRGVLKPVATEEQPRA
jgi:hypothetical protein